MKYIRYSTRELKNIIPDCCMGLCGLREKKRCDKRQECGVDLCEDEMKKIAHIKLFTIRLEREERHKMYDRVDEWRRGQYKKCKAVEFIIKRPQLRNIQTGGRK